MDKKLWVGYDTETTGVSFLNSQVIQVGAIFCDENLNEITRDQWNINFQPNKYEWTSGAEEVHGIPMEEALVHGLDAWDFITSFDNAIKECYGTSYQVKNVYIVGVQSYFDYVMTQNSIYEPNNAKFPMSYKMLGDLSCLGHHLTGVSALNNQLDEHGLEFDNSQRHSALYDAEMHISLFRKLNRLLA
jgi:DNA polymerase III epsilon subunit-like protein